VSRPSITIQWTDTARRSLASLPQKVRRGLLEKTDELLECSDPEEASKTLIGPLQGYYRITYGRYRAIYSVTEDRNAKNDVVIRIVIQFVATGIRKEGDKDDIYRFALKLLRSGAMKPRRG